MVTDDELGKIVKLRGQGFTSKSAEGSASHGKPL